MGGTSNNTPVRNRKVGLPDPQGNGGKSTITTTGPSLMVQDMAAKSVALKNGGQTAPMQGNGIGTPPPVGTVGPGVNYFAGNNRAVGKFEAVSPMQTGPTNPTDFTDMSKPPEFVTQGNGFANPMMGPVASPYMKDAAETTPQNVTNFENMAKQPIGWNPDGTPQYEKQSNDIGYKGGPYDPSKYDSLSAILNGTTSQPQRPQFQADPSKSDGGFFSWLRGLMPKSRPGRREGETDDEYDARRTRNMQMVATFADAIRHMGNIVNTSKGAPLQIFNDPNSMIEQGRQARKAERQKQAKLDADAAQKQAEMTLKQQAAEADRKYKEWLMGLKDDAAQLGKDKFQYRKDKDKAAAEAKAAKDDRDFKYRQERDKVKDKQTEDRLNIAKYNATHKGSGRSGRGGSGSGGKYWFEDKDGKMRYQPNKTMWEQEYYREYGKLPEGESSVSKSTKTVDYKTGRETTTTERTKGASVTSQAAAAQNAAKAARNAKGKSSGNKSKSKNGYKNTKALGL